ncbi:MAG TPA: amylo-alpha-1,6-glucosidase [Solirubrobacteraceae bacterium]|nr:amylo-alpha-1,6-glucosidase [Solirubrobacteraceae bacterium]
MIRLGPQACGTLEEAAAREWLLTDGVGGYAMGTVAGLATRRYHGLLVVHDPASGARSMALLGLDAVCVVGDARVRLGCDEWADGSVDPRGFEQLVSFDLDDGVPRWRWSFGGVEIEREIAMTHGAPGVVVVHRVLRAPRPVRLELTPLCTWRDHHGDRFAWGQPAVEPADGGFAFEGRYRVRGPGWEPGGSWYRGLRHRMEAERGLGDREDVWAAGRFVARVAPGRTAVVAAWAGDARGRLDATVVRGARARAAELARRAGGDALDGVLAVAADRFLVRTPDGPALYAGWPWFGEWSRDAMTSYEGLLLCTGRHEEGAALLRRAAGTLSEGMLANSTDPGLREYNTADATLWFIHAAGRHVAVTGDDGLAAELLPALTGALEHHVNGTRFGIGMDAADGLLRQGAAGWALTWMDARVDGVPVTPRAGKAVEVNALWVNALATAAELARRTGSDPGRWAGLGERARASFAARFRRPDARGLLDVVDGPAGDDAAIRPNQLLAAALPHGPLADRSIVDACTGELLTPLGLRSLSPGDPAYRGRHRGDQAARDRAYHQGTVWPWLIGPYVDAALAAGAPVDGVLAALEAHVADWGLGSVVETCDGDAPHASSGAPFQAWSVAELLRARRRLAGG